MATIKKTALDERHKTSRVRFTAFDKPSEEALPLQTAYNCDCRGGTLKAGVQFAYLLEDGSEVTCTMTPVCTNVFALGTNTGSSTTDGVEYLLMGADGYSYKLNKTTHVAQKKFSMGTNVTHQIFRDQTKKLFNLLASPTKAAYTTAGDTGISMATGVLRGVCLAGNRCFVGGRAGRVFYSEPFVIYRFSGTIAQGGEFYIPADSGEIITVQGDKEYLYIFTETGIYRMRVCAETMDLRLERLDYDGGATCPNGAVATKNGVFFLAASGVYRIQGEKVTRVCERLSILPDVSVDCTFGLCDELVLFEYAEKQADGTSEQKRVAIYTDGEYGFFTETYCFLGNSRYSKLDDKLMKLVKNQADGLSMNPSCYRSQPLELGTRKKKTLKELCVRGRGEVKIVVQTGSVSHEYTLSLTDGVATTRLYEQGKTFTFCLYPTGGSEITSLSVDYVCAE